jgi:hypothetical protein
VCTLFIRRIRLLQRFSAIFPLRNRVKFTIFRSSSSRGTRGPRPPAKLPGTVPNRLVIASDNPPYYFLVLAPGNSQRITPNNAANLTEQRREPHRTVLNRLFFIIFHDIWCVCVQKSHDHTDFHHDLTIISCHPANLTQSNVKQSLNFTSRTSFHRHEP